MHVIGSPVAAQTLAGRKCLKECEAILGIAAFEGRHPFGKFVRTLGQGFLRRGERGHDGGFGPERRRGEQFNSGGGNPFGFFEGFKVLNKEYFGSGSL